MLEDVLKPGPVIATGGHKICYALGDNEVILYGNEEDLQDEQEKLYELARLGFPSLRVKACQFWHASGEPMYGLRAPKYSHHLLFWHTNDPKLYLKNGPDRQLLEKITGDQVAALWDLRTRLLYERVDIEDFQLLVGGPAGEPDIVICDPGNVYVGALLSNGAADQLFAFLQARAQLTRLTLPGTMTP